jgi:hypothetical protein
MIADKQPRPIQELNPEIPDWLGSIISKLMSKQASDRFDSAEQVAKLLEGCLAHIQQPSTTPLPKVATRLVPRQNRASTITKWGGIGAAALMLILFGVFIALETNKGTLTIESNADNVPIKIKQSDDIVKRLIVSREGVTTRLHAGQYTLEIDGTEATYEITDRTVIVKRGEINIAKVTYIENDDRDQAPLAEQRTLADAIREFNNLHATDGKGRPQQPLK